MSALDDARAVVAARSTTRQPRDTPPSRWDGWEANRRRTDAARRLPPLACGCHDPFTVRHQEGRCKWRRRGER